MLLLGAFSVCAGIVAALHPGLTMVALILLMGVNALVTGVLDIIVAVRLRRYMKGELLLAHSGILSIFFGLVVLLCPTGARALALAWMAGLDAVVTGSLLLAPGAAGANMEAHQWRAQQRAGGRCIAQRGRLGAVAGGGQDSYFRASLH